MATEREEIIYSIKLDLEATNEALKAYGSQLTEIRKTQGEMNQTTKEQLDLSEREEKAKKKTKEAIEAEAGSIAALREQNKKLTAERNNTTLATEKGRQRVEELNKMLDENNKIIKDNVDAYTKQKIGIGDYSGALDKLIPGLGATTNGLKATGKEMWALVTNPLGATLIAIGLAFGALMKYFQGSEEGQNRLNKIMLIGSTIMEKIWDLVENLGEAIFNAFTNPKQALLDLMNLIKDQLVNRFVGLYDVIDGLLHLDFKKMANGVLAMGTGVENVIGKVQQLAKETADTFNLAIVQANRLAQLQAKIDQDEREALVQRARVSLEVAKLREKAISEEGDQKRATIEEAIKLEKQLSDAEVIRSQRKLEQAQLELKANGDDKEAKMKVAEAEAAVINAEAQRYEATLRFQKELEKLRDEELKRIQQQALENEKFFDQVQQDAEKQFADQQKQEAAAADKEYKRMLQTAEQKKKVDKDVSDMITKNLGNVLGAQTINYKAGFDLFKKGALLQLLAETNKAAVAAMASASSIPIVGWLLGPLAYAATYAKGIASYALVQGTSLGFARGGMLRGKRHSQGGIPITVSGRPGYEAEDGEVVINRRSTAMYRPLLSKINEAGGGVKFERGGLIGGMNVAQSFETRAAQESFNTSRISSQLERLIEKPLQPVLVYDDVEAKQYQKNQTTELGRVI